MQPQNEKPATEQEATEQEKTKEKDTTLPMLTYQVNIKNDGWIPSVKDGSVSGKAASSKPIESFKLYLKDSDGNSAVRYRAHMIGDGWQDSWKTSGYIAGTQGKSKYIDAFKVAMTDDYKALYDVYYRAYVQGYGWLGWAHNGEIAGSTGTEMPIEAIAVKIVQKGTNFDVKGSCILKTPSLSYQSYIKGTGWQNAVGDAKTSGTNNTPIEAVKVTYTGFDGENAININSHNNKTGWQGWKNGGETSGVTGSANCYNAVKMKLNSTMSKYYDIYYRVYVDKYGWLGWAKNGEVAGSGLEMAVDAIQVKAVKKNAFFDVGGICSLKTPKLSYQAHVEDVGWQAEVGNASTAGTTGQSKAMEAIKITYTGFDGKNAITYNSHLANKGWQGWKNGGEISGTTGERRQMEAIQIKLNATMSKYYDIYYRMHVQDKGWLGWAANGEPAGTVYGGLRAEAIQIRIVAKGSKFERNGTAYYELTPATQTNNSTNQVASRINELESKLCGKYFNKHRNSECGAKSSGHGCSNCLTSNIVKQTWFKNEFGNISTNQFPYTPTSDVNLSRDAMSCAGFAAFAEWYIYKNSTTDTINVNKIGTYAFNSANVNSHIQVGDLIRLEVAGGGKGHSAIVVGWDSSGITVMDCNWSATYNCLVQKHKIYYSTGYYGLITISRHK